MHVAIPEGIKLPRERGEKKRSKAHFVITQNHEVAFDAHGQPHVIIDASLTLVTQRTSSDCHLCSQA